MTKSEKISNSLKKYYSENGHPTKGKPGWKHSDEMKEHKRRKAVEAADRRGRVSEAHRKARVKASVYAYRARQRGLILDDSNLKLIKRIYENCPEGYDVDHIVPLAKNGAHHQDNLRYLTVSENRRKGSRTDYTPPQDSIIEWKELIKIGECAER